jgi:hypothetical protein
MTRKQDLLTFVSIVCLENSVESSSIQASTKQVVHWIISIQIYGVPLRFHQRVVLDILLHLLIIIQEKSRCIFFFLKKKSDVFVTFKQCKTLIEN